MKKLVSLALLTFSISSAFADANNENDKTSYALGYLLFDEMVKGIVPDVGIDKQPDIFYKGLADGASDKPMTKEDFEKMQYYAGVMTGVLVKQNKIMGSSDTKIDTKSFMAGADDKMQDKPSVYGDDTESMANSEFKPDFLQRLGNVFSSVACLFFCW